MGRQMIVFRNMAVDILTESGTLCSELVHTEPISVQAGAVRLWET